eukprot:jgi/Botrbrau1/5250/Bobra.0172s0110.1
MNTCHQHAKVPKYSRLMPSSFEASISWAPTWATWRTKHHHPSPKTLLNTDRKANSKSRPTNGSQPGNACNRAIYVAPSICNAMTCRACHDRKFFLTFTGFPAHLKHRSDEHLRAWPPHSGQDLPYATLQIPCGPSVICHHTNADSRIKLVYND